MKNKIAVFLYHQAKKHHFDNKEVIEDLIHSSEESYDHFIQKGFSDQQAFLLVQKTLGDIKDVFCFSSKPESKMVIRQLIINIILSVSAIATVILGYALHNINLFLLINGFVVMTLLVCFLFITYQKNTTHFHQQSFLSRHIYCILVNIAIVFPTLLNVTLNEYMQSVGLIAFVTNIGFIYFISKSGIKILLITLPCSILSLLLWFQNDWYLAYLYIIILIIVCSSIFLYYEIYTNEPHSWLLIGFTILFFIVSAIVKIPWPVVSLSYIPFSAAGCVVYYLRRRRSFSFHFDKVNLHLSILFYAIVFSLLFTPVIDIFKKAFAHQAIVGIDYFTPLVWSMIILCIDFIYFLCYHYIKDCRKKHTI